MKKTFFKIISLILAFTMVIGLAAAGISGADFGVRAQAVQEREYNLEIVTKFFRYDEYYDNYIETMRIAPGDRVKARVFVSTDYPTANGEMIFFFNNEFFLHDYSYSEVSEAVFNDSPTSSANINQASGNMIALNYGSFIIEDLLYDGYISEEFAQIHDAFAINFNFGTRVCNQIESDEWFAEFDLFVREDVTSDMYGCFFAEKSTAATPDAPWGYINVPVGEYGGRPSDMVNMWDCFVNCNFISDPVVTTGTITFSADGGKFVNGELEIQLEGVIGEVADFNFSTPARDGYYFNGWIDRNTGNPVELDREALTFGYEDKVYVPIYEEPINKYVTELYFQDVSGEYPEMPDRIMAFEGISGDIVFYQPEEFEGYEFNPDLSLIEAELKRDGSTVLRAYYSREKYEVSFIDHSGSFDEYPLVRTYYYGGLVEEPADPTMKGYKFEGWFDENGNKVSFPFEMPAEHISLTSEWTEIIIPEYKVTWYRYAEEVLKVQSYKAGDEIVCPDIPDMEGMTFIGWADSNGNINSLPDKMPEENLAFYAVFEINKHKVMFVSDGKTVFEHEDVPFGSEIPVPEPIKKDGFIFDGWTPEIPAYMPDEDVVFHAKWIPDNYTVTYVDGENVIEERSMAYGQQLELIEAAPKAGYIFAGWSYNGELINEQFKMPDCDITLEAVWAVRTDVSYRVEKYYMNAQGEYELIEETRYGTAYEWVEVVPNVEEGFYVDVAESVMTGVIDPENELVLKIYYNRNSYSVTYYSDGQEVDAFENVLYGAEIPVSDIPQKYGFIFVGWSPEIPACMPDSDIEFHAVWEAESYKITYNIGSETVEHVYKYGEKIDSDINIPEGYEFIKWVDENGNNAAIPETMPAQNIVLTAKLKGVRQNSIFDVSSSFDDDCFGSETEKVIMKVDETSGETDKGSVYVTGGVNHHQVASYRIKMVIVEGENERIKQPENGKTVTIRVPIPEGCTEHDSFKIVHRFAGGGREVLTATAKNGYLEFVTGKFSIFEIYVAARLTLSEKPDNTEVIYKGSLNLDGIELTYKNPDGTTQTVTDPSKMTVKGFDSSKIGTQTVSVEYAGESVQFDVNVSYAWWQWIIRILLLGFIWY
ncbi:MAG: InlB B-repeat-containing protein [Clostridia bacterium]|nr:InlB B-repeat-containing protein [Clostridia bacterium]